MTTAAQLAATQQPLYVNPNNDAAQTAASTTDTSMKRVMTRLASTPTAVWFGNWNSDITNDASNVVGAAAAAKQLPVLVAYNILDRDCGGYSSGGATSAGAYETWIAAFAAGIGNRSALVIFEPDALGEITCLSSADQSTRYQLLNYAVLALKANPNTRVYIDAGNPPWVAAGDMANRLQSAGIARADGFSLNVSNFVPTSDNIAYGHQISSLVGGKHFVIDTSRNGNGASGDWCNPIGRALGNTPTANTGDSLADYFLYIKMPGESDGTCNGGPAAGTWWPDYAKTLALNAGW
jgi:endoglucanase